jgi:hypothetical protein
VIALTSLKRRESFDIPRGPAKMPGHGVVTRGAIATPEEAQQIAAYLVAQFGSD